jgi:hypothetical protein
MMRLAETAIAQRLKLEQANEARTIVEVARSAAALVRPAPDPLALADRGEISSR